MRNIDIYKKKRLIFVKRKSFPMRALKVLSLDQGIDLLAVTGGLLLVWLLLALWEPQNPNKPQELSTKPALSGFLKKWGVYRLSSGA